MGRLQGDSLGRYYANVRLFERNRPACFDDSRGDGVSGQARGVVDAQFAHEVLPVFLDGFDADAEFRGGLLVSHSLGNQLEHFPFTRGGSAPADCRRTGQQGNGRATRHQH